METEIINFTLADAKKISQHPGLLMSLVFVCWYGSPCNIFSSLKYNEWYLKDDEYMDRILESKIIDNSEISQIDCEKLSYFMDKVELPFAPLVCGFFESVVTGEKSININKDIVLLASNIEKMFYKV